MKYFPKISGARIYLSPMNIDDFEIYTKWLNDRRVTDGLGNTKQLFSLEKEKRFLEDMVKDGYNFAIIRASDHELIGNASLFDIHHVSRSATCGLFIGEEENRGLGYGSEALRLLLTYGFDTLNLVNVMLKVFSFNKAAIKCYERNGFKLIGARRKSCFHNGEYHDDVFMDITADDFNKIRSGING